MKVLLVNPPNSGRSIPEERYGITSLKQIFRGEPLALEVLAGNLDGHQVAIVDLKADPEGLKAALELHDPDLIGLTAVTCEANTVLALARRLKQACGAEVVVGGSHASNDPDFFNQPEIDYVAIGLGKQSLRELVDALESGLRPENIAGIARTTPGQPLRWLPRAYNPGDLVDAAPPRYDLVARYRDSYTLASLGLKLGFVTSAYGCTHDCDFCCIAGQAGGRYLTADLRAVTRDIELLDQVPVIRLVDANTFGNPAHARALAEAIRAAGIKKSFLADVRSDTVVKHPKLIRLWREIGLKSVIIGFEEICDSRLGSMNKANSSATNREAIRILHDLGITIVGDFIVDPDYAAAQFAALHSYLAENPIDLPIFTVLTPLPGTRLYGRLHGQIVNHDLDYYTLTNAVLPTRLPEDEFYRRYADLMTIAHTRAKL
jgi:hopanoid C-3 methylase